MATTEDEFDPKKAKLDTPSPQTVLQMQQTFGNRATIQMLRQRTIQRDDFGLADASEQMVAQYKDKKKNQAESKKLNSVFKMGEDEASQMVSNYVGGFARTLKKKDQAGLTLAKLLEAPDSVLFQQFYDYLENEAQTTNSLEFLVDVAKYKKNPAIGKAQDIYKRWILDPWTLNIGDVAKKQIHKNITGLAPSPYGQPVHIGAEMYDDDEDDYPVSRKNDPQRKEDLSAS